MIHAVIDTNVIVSALLTHNVQSATKYNTSFEEAFFIYGDTNFFIILI